MNRKRILFVDDDESILRTFQNVFRRDRERWEVVTVVGGEAALEAVRQTPFDVVVSDMRMPGIDGATLLERVRLESPRTVRLMLSGSAESAEIARTSNTVHELLTKPCDTPTLRATIERWLQDPALDD